MSPTGFEPMLRKATIKAVDSISKKASKAERKAEGVVGKLLTRWNAMSAEEKEQVASIVIATATTAVTAIAALRKRKKSSVKKKLKKKR